MSLVYRESGTRSYGLIALGAFKLTMAFLFFLAGVGLLRVIDRDISEVLRPLIIQMALDPEKHFIASALSWLDGADYQRRVLIDAAAFVYGALYALEGIGLVLRRRWAEYLVIFATSLLLPFEIYEIIEKTSLIRVGIFLFNLAVIAYLVGQLHRNQKSH